MHKLWNSQAKAVCHLTGEFWICSTFMLQENSAEANRARHWQTAAKRRRAVAGSKRLYRGLKMNKFHDSISDPQTASK